VRPGRSSFRLAGGLLPVLLLAAAGLVVAARFLIQARADLGLAEAARARGDEAEAARSFEDVLRLSLPGSPYERRALDGLRAAAAGARAAGDGDGERRAWEAVRTGLQATRSLFTPYPARLAEAEGRLEALDAAEAFPPRDRTGALRAVDIDGRAGRFGRGARRPRALAGVLVALVGFAAWVGAVVLFILRGLDRQVRLRRAPRAFWQVILPVVFVAGFALFLCGSRLG
jgi:hypothetical protein